MKLDAIRWACALSAVWGLIVLLAGIANLLWPGYAEEFLRIIDSMYPGYHYGLWGFGGVAVATLYAIIDGWVIGVIFAWLYNLFTKRQRV